MGQWNITVRGLGIHHNKMDPHDANRMAAKFVQDLKDAGHQVASATITAGFEEDITDPETYLSNRDKIEAPPPPPEPPTQE